MAIFGSFRRLIDVLETLVIALGSIAGYLQAIIDIQRELGPGLDRLEKLELSRAMHEAEMAALVLRAESKYKAAANAEARERTLQKSKLVDDFDLESAETEAHPGGPVLSNDAGASEAQGVQPVHLGLAPNDKAHAVAFKFAGGR